MKSLKKNMTAVLAALSLALLPLCVSPASAANTKTTVAQVTTAVALTTDVDYIVTDADPFGSGGVVDIQNTDHAVLILSNVKPTAAIKLLAAHVTINGEKAVSGTNCQVKLYNRGAIIMPYARGFKPLTVYSGQNFEGEAVSDFGLENSGGFMNTLTDAKLNNRIRSFKLKRGYMVTFANKARGRGYSRCFIAADEDLEVPVMPGILDNSISSYRLFQWFDAGKPQLAAATGDAAACDALNVTSTYTWGVGGSMAPNVESVSHHIYEDYPSPGACGGATWTAHMKTNNEPRNTADDHPQNLETILNNWENLMATGMRLCSPSSWDGSDYWNGTGFLKEFFDSIDARGWRCDILDMHCYWGGNFGNLRNWVNAVHRPIWISEWCYGASWNNNGAFAAGATEEGVRDALKNICGELNGMDFVERYFYWNGERDPSRLYKDGKLTPAGEMYAGLDGGLAYNGKYDYAPKVPAQGDPRDLVVSFDKSAHTAVLSWYDPNGEMNAAVTVERRKSASENWTELATVAMKEKAGTCTFEDGTAANGYQYRIHVVDANRKDRYTNSVTAASDDLGAGDNIEVDGATKYIGGNIFLNGTFDMGLHGWKNGKGEMPAQPWFQVVPVGGYENGPYLQSYGNGAADSESAIKTVFDIKANTDYYFSGMAANTASIYAQLCFTEDGDKSAKIIKYLNNNTNNWMTQYQTFNSADYTKVLVSCRMLGATTQLDNLMLAQLFDTEAEAIADGVEKARQRAEAFMEYCTVDDINAELRQTLESTTGTDQEALFAIERAVAQAIQANNTLPKLNALIPKGAEIVRLGLDTDGVIASLINASGASATAILSRYTALQAAISEYFPQTNATVQPQQPKFAAATGWTTKCGTYTGGDQRTNKQDGITFWNAWWSGLSASEGTAKTMEVKQDVKGLAHGLYTLECKATTEHYCLSDQHAYLTRNVSGAPAETVVTTALSANYYDLPTVAVADRWETLATMPVYVGEGDTVTVGFVGSKQGAVDNAWREIGNKTSSGDKREGWWCATDFVLRHMPLYKAAVTPGEWHALCLPYDVTPGEGITMYQIVGITPDYTKLCLETIDNSKAGVPFLYTSADADVTFFESGTPVKNPTDGNSNLRGYLKTTSHVLENYYYLEDGQWLKCTQAFKDRPFIGNFGAIIRPFTDSSAQPVTIYKGWKGLTLPISGITEEEKEHNDTIAKVIAAETIRGDVNGDSSVDVADISTIITAMAAGSSPDDRPAADVNGDGSIDVADIAAVITIMAEE